MRRPHPLPFVVGFSAVVVLAVLHGLRPDERERFGVLTLVLAVACLTVFTGYAWLARATWITVAQAHGGPCDGQPIPLPPHRRAPAEVWLTNPERPASRERYVLAQSASPRALRYQHVVTHPAT